MRKHLVSFLRAPIGYILNAVASLPCMDSMPDSQLGCIGQACDAMCIADGVQDEPISYGRW